MRVVRAFKAACRIFASSASAERFGRKRLLIYRLRHPSLNVPSLRRHFAYAAVAFFAPIEPLSAFSAVGVFANGAKADIVETADISVSVDPKKVEFEIKFRPGMEQEFVDVVKRMGGEVVPDIETANFSSAMWFDASVMRQHIQQSFPQLPADRPAPAIKGLVQSSAQITLGNLSWMMYQCPAYLRPFY